MFIDVLLMVAAQAVAPSTADDTPLPGIYSNEEQVYFAKEAGKPAPPLVMLRIDGHPHPMQSVTAFGEAAPFDPAGMTLSGRGERISGRLPDGTTLELRRARPATCWTAIAKKQPKADGSPDWFFVRDVKLHDQGGRALVGGGDSGADPLVIRIRNVVWPPTAEGKPATNRPSIVLYVHKPDQPDRAESYVWADPGAARIGINLRWMQASCGIDGAEAPN